MAHGRLIEILEPGASARRLIEKAKHGTALRAAEEVDGEDVVDAVVGGGELDELVEVADFYSPVAAGTWGVADADEGAVLVEAAFGVPVG